MSGPAFPAGPGDDDREKAQSALARYQVVRRRVGQVAVALLACLVLFVGSAHSPALHTGIEQTGIVLIALGVGGRVWCTLYIGGRKSEMIVDQGPYSLTRNPLYLFSSVAATGVGALMGSFVAAILAGVLCALAFRIVILREEEYLRTNLGAGYADYVARVPRFLPDFRLYRDCLLYTSPSPRD